MNSSSLQDYQLGNEAFETLNISSSSKLKNYYTNGYQTSESFYPKTNHKKYGSNKLTMFKFNIKNVPINPLEMSANSKNNIYNIPKLENFHKKVYSQNKEYNGNYSQRLYTSENENINIINLNNSCFKDVGNNDYSNYKIKLNHQITSSDFSFYYPSKTKYVKYSKGFYVKKKDSDQNKNNENVNIINNNNYYNTEIYSNSKKNNDYKDIKDKLNSSVDDLTNDLTTNYLDTANIAALSNYNPNYNDEEPKSKFKLTDLTILNEIGKGSEGVIYVIRWNKNNKKYAMKKVQIMFSINVKKRKNDSAALRSFIERTGCDGIIKPYGITCIKNEIGFTDVYEIMELAEKDWESEISSRRKEKRYYSENELMEIFRNLIKTFALLQTNHITHRDIKPQNIMFSHGKMKICDFGNARVLKRNGIIIQRIRGSGLFMSPIVYKGYRSGIQNIRHNAYKSDVYSLGVCFFLAASLSYDGPNIIRQIEDMNKIKKTVEFNLGKRYSAKMIDIILTMLRVEESQRPDFLTLQALFP